MVEIKDVAKKIGVKEDDLECYGRYMAKVKDLNFSPKGHLILVTAITPTRSGEGKTTVSIGLADALARLHKRVAVALREPSLGPTFGMKGGATGGGRATM